MKSTKQKLLRAYQKNEKLSVYHHGETWYDLCRGPHLEFNKKIGKAFKLTKVSGAYWRGDSIMKCYKEFMEHVGAQKKN